MTLAGRLRDELDLAFGKLLEARYSDIVPSEILTTDLFYEKFIAPRRRTASAVPRKAVILVIDSMRLDIWRELVRPALEHDSEMEESIGFALLPSETRISRRAFFAGKPPAAMPRAGRESELFAALLSSIHGTRVVFEDLPHRPKGMAFGVRSRDGSVHAAVFDFPDVLSHGVDWDPHTLHEAQRPARSRTIWDVVVTPETIVPSTAAWSAVSETGDDSMLSAETLTSMIVVRPTAGGSAARATSATRAFAARCLRHTALGLAGPGRADPWLSQLDHVRLSRGFERFPIGVLALNAVERSRIRRLGLGRTRRLR
jgi:PglZ domain-containing protein